MIEIKLLNKRLLSEYINSDSYIEQRTIPISKHRALSQLNNPCLDEKDMLLLIASENDKMVGYLGALPDRIFLNNKSGKIGWLTCFWVDASMRHKGIGIALLKESLKVWGNKLLFADYVPETKKVYDKLDAFCKKPYTKTGIRLYIKSDLYSILPPKKSVFSRTKYIFKLIDFIINIFLNGRLHFFTYRKNDLKFEYIEQIDEEAESFISARQKKQVFRRNKDDLNWIVNNPWILSAPVNASLSKKYYFSSFAKSFNFYPLKIRNQENELIAFLIFSKKDGYLKMPYCYHNNNEEAVIEAINYHIVKWKIKTFTTFHTEIVQNLKKVSTPALFKKTVERNYILSTIFKDIFFEKDIEIQDGDGDCCFT